MNISTPEPFRWAHAGQTVTSDNCESLLKSSKVRGMFQVIELAYGLRESLALLLSPEIDSVARDTRSGEIIQAIASLETVMRYLEYGEPDIMTLSSLVLPLWPGQPLNNYGESQPILKALYFHLKSAWSQCCRALGCECYSRSDEFAVELEGKISLVPSRMSEMAKWVEFDLEDDGTSTIIWRLCDLYICRYGDSLPPGYCKPNEAEQAALNERYPRVSVDRVRQSMDKLGWKTKPDAIRLDCRMNRQRCFAIIRMLKADREAEPGT